MAVNCGACADTLLESELFGHARGAFTGAVQDRLGVFEAAQGGTLLLDEIGDISPAMQVKLLRVVQERELRRVGETKVRPVDVRLIAATHRDLRQEVAHKRFRQDLYYRLHVIDLVIPPLRERPEDLRALAAELLARTARAPAATDPAATRRAPSSRSSATPGRAMCASSNTRLNGRVSSPPVRRSTSRTCRTWCAAGRSRGSDRGATAAAGRP